MKDINFLSGFYRSGSTLLTVLLNQHPEIYSSHQSDLSSVLELTQNSFNNLESYVAGNNKNRYYQMLENMPQNFYQDIDKKNIIDKSRFWGHPESFKFMNMVNKNYKIIFTYRPILEILTSFVIINRKNPNNIFMKNCLELKYPSIYYRNEEDALCDYIVNLFLEPSIRNMSILKNNENSEKVFFLEYNNFINNTQLELSKIYNFLKVKDFKNDLDNIIDREVPDDSYFGADLHTVSPKIIIPDKDPKKVLSSYVIDRYGQLLDGII